ncbi:hypothetical protein F1559_002553 [Cyanidiococcus yangmingshanensis]|uniref:Uncharacterized protein n=1 Tax=Cyanidiococcus yangmingshanensis TaxID=2690220 RepID=A0A7J7IDA6_9RHOD|nr:hypothetical protein F1559_002553 [Cyanidiococcus yangmingshanensis]
MTTTPPKLWSALRFRDGRLLSFVFAGTPRTGHRVALQRTCVGAERTLLVSRRSSLTSSARLLRPVLLGSAFRPQRGRRSPRGLLSSERAAQLYRHLQSLSDMVPRTIATHSGTFHCDEVLACYMLRLLPEFQDAPITRTRDPELLATIDCVVDVGAEYDPDRLRFDHHQRSFNDTFSAAKKTRLSSAGLVYKHFGRELIRQVTGTSDEVILELLYTRVYDGFIEAIDGNDNGIDPTDERPRYIDSTTLPSRVARLNTPWNQEESQQEQFVRFAQAMEMAGTEFVAYVRGLYEQWLPARAVVLEAFRHRFDVHSSGRIVLLERWCPWKTHLYDIETEHSAGGAICFVLYKDTVGMWRVQAVNKPDSFENRLALPMEWRGLQDAELEQVTGISGCTFVHASGFIGGNKTYDGVLAMATKALSQQTEPALLS